MTAIEKEESSYRLLVLTIATFAAVLLIIVVSLTTQVAVENSTELRLPDILFDRSMSLYPFTIQNLMWLCAFVCAGEIWVRWNRANKELAQLQRGLISDDDSLLYRAKDLVPVYSAIMADKASAQYYLQRLVKRIITQFQISQSTEQTNSILNSSLELFQHEVDLKYNMVRYMVWLIPTLGFIGTVIGIALALSQAGAMPDITDSVAIKGWVAAITIKLGIAFNTTLVALIMSAILVFWMNIAQGREEKALNHVGQYCLERLVNRLIAKE